MRPFNDWELDAIRAFIGLTTNKVITPLAKDILIWKGDALGCFTVKANFNKLEGVSPYSVPTKMLWNTYVPLKIGFFAWEAWYGKVLTSSQLKKRGFHLASKCPSCGKKEEELKHILNHCPSIWGQWTDLLFAFGASLVCPL